MAVVYEGQGHWWLPGKEEKKVAGTITFDSEKGGNLSLIGALSRWTDFAEVVPTDGGGVRMDRTLAVEERTGNYPMVYGQINGKAVTLQDAYQTHVSENLMLGEASEERVHVNRVFTDVWWGEGESPAADALSVSLAYLDDWALEQYIGEKLIYNQADSRIKGLELHVEKREDRFVLLEDGTTFTLRYHYGNGGRRSTKRHLSQGYSLRLDLPEVTPVNDAIDIASDFQDLVSIATGRNAAFQHVWGFHPDLARELDPEDKAGKRTPFPFEVFARWNIQDRAAKPDEIEPHEMFFTFADLGGMEGIEKWMRPAKKYRSTLGRTMGIRARDGMFMSDRLLNYAAALEGFDRQKTGVTTNDLPARLRRCIDLAGEPFKALIGHVTWWVEAVTWHRNDIAHHLGREPRGPAVQQHYLAESLYWLAVYVMLREADAPQEVYDRIGAHQHFHYLGPKIRAAVTAYGQAAAQPSPATSPTPALETASTRNMAADADASPDAASAPDAAPDAAPEQP